MRAKLKSMNCIVLATLLVGGCGMHPVEKKISSAADSKEHSKEHKQVSQVDQADQVSKEKKVSKEDEYPKVYKDSDGKYFITKEGLDIFTTPPTAEGPEKVAWEFFELSGEHRYDEALELMAGYIKNDRSKGRGRKLLEEIVGAKFIRLADVTSIAPKEGEVEDAYDYRVIYIECVFKLRGVIDPDSTQMRNGLGHYAVHLIQEKADSDWKIVLLGGSPTLEQ